MKSARFIIITALLLGSPTYGAPCTQGDGSDKNAWTINHWESTHSLNTCPASTGRQYTAVITAISGTKPCVLLWCDDKITPPEQEWCFHTSDTAQLQCPRGQSLAIGVSRDMLYWGGSVSGIINIDEQQPSSPTSSSNNWVPWVIGSAAGVAIAATSGFICYKCRQHKKIPEPLQEPLVGAVQ